MKTRDYFFNTVVRTFFNEKKKKTNKKQKCIDKFMIRKMETITWIINNLEMRRYL